jgi:hypothetical protein
MCCALYIHFIGDGASGKGSGNDASLGMTNVVRKTIRKSIIASEPEAPLPFDSAIHEQRAMREMRRNSSKHTMGV